MITFVQWAKEIDSPFRAFYPTVALESETVEPEPRQNATHYLLGTARLNEAAKAALLNQFGENVMLTDDQPEGY